MSASRNAEAVSQQGEFSSRVPRDEPLTTKGHKPGINTGNDAVPEFHAQTLPPGTAPSNSTFTPNPTSETPGQADNELAGRQHGKEDTSTSASSTLGGSDSSDVYTGMGHPGQGQTSNELRSGGGGGGGDGKGLVGVSGAGGVPSGNQMVDERTQAGQRGLEREEAGVKDTVGGTEGAEERENVKAGEL